MSDEYLEGQPTETAAAPQEPTAPPAPQVPPKFEGKPEEELVKSLHRAGEVQRATGPGTGGTEERDFLPARHWLSRGGLRLNPMAPPVETMPEFDWQNPYRSLDAYLDKRLAAREKVN